ncbi:MAG TPA: anti-sigma factor [Pyrinomonadaceae bacterium]|nr:anti-sigma factor [Pyrinomonadaceae bacterium]
MGHEDYRELLALEAAGALDGDESRALAEHLSSCGECRRELAELRDTAASLLYTLTPVAPPARLRTQVLEQVRALGDAPPASEVKTQAATRRAGVEDEGTASRTPSTARAPRPDARPGLWQLLTGRPSFAFGTLAASLVIVALGVTSFALWQRNRELSAETARLSARLEDLRQELAAGREQLARAQEVNDLLMAPGAAMATLKGMEVAPQAHASVAFDRNSGRVVLLASALPPAPAGKAYQLWFITDDKKVLPGGVFKTDAEGQGRLDDRLPQGVSRPSAFAVTLEDERGVPKAEGSMYLLSAAS